MDRSETKVRWIRSTLLCTAMVVAISGCAQPNRRVHFASLAQIPDDWRLVSERTNFVETGHYAEAVEFCRKLAAASPYAHYTTFGTTGEGRPLPLLIVSKVPRFD